MTISKKPLSEGFGLGTGVYLRSISSSPSSSSGRPFHSPFLPPTMFGEKILWRGVVWYGAVWCGATRRAEEGECGERCER